MKHPRTPRWPQRPHLTAMLGLATALATLAPAPAPAQSPPAPDAAAPEPLRPSTTLAEFPVNTFLENLVVRADGIYFTSHTDGRLMRWRAGGAAQLWAQLPGKIAGIAPTPAQGWVVTAFDPQGRAVVHTLDATGRLLRSTPIEGAQFLNGIEALGGDRYLIADAYRGVVWLFDGPSQQARVWLQSPLLARADAQNPLPAANGIRRAGQEVFISNTARQLLLRVPLQRDGSAGTPRVWKEQLNIDDFAIDAEGTVWAATHIHDSVIRIDAQGAVSTVARAAQGMTGSTAVALSADGGTAYVTTNGGMFLPPPGGVQPARLLALPLR